MNRPTPILPSVYQETLTYGETLGVVAQKVNECVDAVNANDGKVDDLTNFVGTFDNRITENTNEISATKEDVNTLSSNLSDAVEQFNQFSQNTETQLEDFDGRLSEQNDYLSTVGMTADDAMALANSLNPQVKANTAAINKLNQKMTLLADITLQQDTTGIFELIRDTKLTNFYIETSIPKASATSSGQLILDYGDGTTYLTAAFARNSAVTNMTINAFENYGVQLVFIANHSASSVNVLGTSSLGVKTGDIVVSRIRFQLITSGVAIPANSTFKIYGILED